MFKYEAMFFVVLAYASEGMVSLTNNLTVDNSLSSSTKGGYEIPAEIQDFVNALGCKCVNLKCQCITEHGTNLSTRLEKILTSFHHNVTQETLSLETKPGDLADKNNRGKNLSPWHVETFARSLGCECINSRCRCVSSNSGEKHDPDALNDLLEYLDQRNTQVAALQESLGSQVRGFFRDSFRWLKEFARRPH
jgi:hypothetical protein